MAILISIVTIIATIVYFARKKYKKKNLVSDIEVDIDEFLEEPAYKRYLNSTEGNSKVEVQNSKSKSTESSLDKPSYLRVNINEHSQRHHDWLKSNE